MAFRKGTEIKNFSSLSVNKQKDAVLTASMYTIHTPESKFDRMNRKDSKNGFKSVRKLKKGECSNLLVYHRHVGDNGNEWCHPSSVRTRKSDFIRINPDFTRFVAGIIVNFFCIRKADVSIDAFAYFSYEKYKKNFRIVTPLSERGELREEKMVYDIIRDEFMKFESTSRTWYKNDVKYRFPDIVNDGTRRHYVCPAEIDDNPLSAKEKRAIVRRSKTNDYDIAMIKTVNKVISLGNEDDKYIHKMTDEEIASSGVRDNRRCTITDDFIALYNSFCDQLGVKHLAKSTIEKKLGSLLSKAEGIKCRNIGGLYNMIKIMDITPKATTKKLAKKKNVSEASVRSTMKKLFDANILAGKTPLRNLEFIRKDGRLSKLKFKILYSSSRLLLITTNYSDRFRVPRTVGFTGRRPGMYDHYIELIMDESMKGIRVA